MSEAVKPGIASRAAALADTPAVRLETLAATIEFAPLGIAHFDREGNFLLVNQRLAEMLGRARDDVLRRNFFELHFPEDLPSVLELTARVAEGALPGYRHESRLVREDGSLMWACVSVSAARHGDGRLDFFIGMVEDIGEQRRAEEQRREAEATLQRARDEASARESQLHAIANAIPQMAWIAQPDGRRTWFNERWFAYTGLRPEEAEGFGWQRTHHPDHAARVVTRQRDSFRRGEAWEDNFPLRASDGTFRWFASRAVPMRDASGTPHFWFGTYSDINAQMEALQSTERVKRECDERVAAIVHDLRNPLHTITLATGTLDSSATLDADRRRRLLDMIRRTAVDMGRVLDAALEATRRGG
jgi:PAS domain S-box-containing protein